VDDYRRAAARVTAAFAAADVVPDRFALHELGSGAVFPAVQAISFHFVDYLVHAWDVARSIEVAFRPDEDLLESALTITLAVSTGDARTKPGAVQAGAGRGLRRPVGADPPAPRAVTLVACDGLDAYDVLTESRQARSSLTLARSSCSSPEMPTVNRRVPTAYRAWAFSA